jgi:hypothetical protein
MSLNVVATELARGPANKLGPSVPPPACEVSARAANSGPNCVVLVFAAAVSPR